MSVSPNIKVQRQQRTTQEEIDTFWSRVNKRGPDECWEWTAGVISRKKFQYGAFIFRGRRQPAHRIAYELTHGKLGDGRLACHTCDNPKCCNPSHIYSGTYQSNMDDRTNRKRLKAKKGSENAMAKLTEDAVKEIREIYSRKFMDQYELAAKYGVSQSRISRVINRHRWQHVI